MKDEGRSPYFCKTHQHLIALPFLCAKKKPQKTIPVVQRLKVTTSRSNLRYFFFSAFLIFFSAFFSFGVLAGAFFVSFLLSVPLLMTATPLNPVGNGWPYYTTHWSRSVFYY